MSGVLLSQWADLPAIPVSSSNVASGAYADDFGRLFVEFNNGSIYAYENVPPAVWQSFLTAASKGKWVNQILKAGGYGYRKVR